jgi:hypothetical protein
MARIQHTGTLKRISASRITRQYAKVLKKKRRAPTTAEQKKKQVEKRKKNQQTLAQGVAEWRAQTDQKAQELAEQLGKTKQYVLNAMMNDGASLVRHREKTNAFNAFKSVRMAQINEGSSH